MWPYQRSHPLPSDIVIADFDRNFDGFLERNRVRIIEAILVAEVVSVEEVPKPRLPKELLENCAVFFDLENGIVFDWRLLWAKSVRDMTAAMGEERAKEWARRMLSRR